MPGHKGRGSLPPFDAAAPYDITEIAGADSLFEANGILAQSEQATAALYGSKASKQEFRETLAGVRKLLSEEHNESSPCVIAFCLLSEIMPHKKELNSSDIAFFLDIYRKTDSKIIQHALYTAILNGDNAIKHREIILESGTWLDVYYLYLSLIATTDGEEREAWKKQLQRLKMKSPILGKWIDSSLEDFRKSKRR